MDRKKFLKKIGLGMLAGSTITASCLEEQEVPNSQEDCDYTGSDALGPFFVDGTANIVNLNTRKLPGDGMKVMGTVYGGNDRLSPLANAKIEIWHCDSGGIYYPEGSGDVTDYDEDEITLRGFVLSAADGTYGFSSIYPGLYGSRARHIHYKVEADGYKTLVTQSYFEGDNRISLDSLSRDAGDCRIVHFSPDANGILQGEMDFHLEPA